METGGRCVCSLYNQLLINTHPNADDDCEDYGDGDGDVDVDDCDYGDAVARNYFPIVMNTLAFTTYFRSVLGGNGDSNGDGGGDDQLTIGSPGWKQVNYSANVNFMLDAQWSNLCRRIVQTFWLLSQTDNIRTSNWLNF